MKQFNKGILISFFNSNNLGDLLISENLYEDYSPHFTDLKKCSFEGNFNIINKIEKPNARSKNIFYRVKNSLLNRVKRHSFKKKYNQEIKEAEVLVIGGGNMLMSLNEKDMAIKNFEFYVKCALKYNVKVIVPSIGTGPFYSQDDLKRVRNVIYQCDVVTYRDHNSRNQILGDKDLKNHLVSVDPVFKLPLFKKRLYKNRYNKIGVGVINTYLFNNSKDYYEKVKQNYLKLTKFLLDNNKEVVLFSTEIADEKMLIDIDETLSHENLTIVHLENIQDLFNLYKNEIDYLIAARMHSLIIAFTQYIPMIGLSWQQKVDNLFTVINQENRVYSLDDFDKYIKDINQMLNSVKENDISENERQLDLITKKYISFNEIRHLVK